MFLDEIKDRLVAEGVGVFGTSIILGSKGKIPDGDGPYISLTETGGSAPRRVHNIPGAYTQRPSAQVCVRAKSYIVARAKAKEAYTALDGVFNQTLTGVMYYSITATQEPTNIGNDEKERPMIVFNIEAEKDPS